MKDLVLITGSAGLIGSEAVRFFTERGYDIIGVDNDMRARLFGPDASTQWNRQALAKDCSGYTHIDADIRDKDAMACVFQTYGNRLALIIHTAAQPSHDWAATDPVADFTINANGTLVLLEECRKSTPDVPFIFTSTNKVYGDRPNDLPLVEQDRRFEIDTTHGFHAHGIDETMPIDRSLHSLFGVSKTAADLLVQEYGRYFGMKTACFRGGCLTGPGHSGTALHGFLAYLMKCTATGAAYTVFGYDGKQVRDNIHSFDLVNAFWHFFQKPRSGEVYNIGGGRRSNCSMLEAIGLCEDITGRRLSWEYSETNRTGDHIWWISDTRRFEAHYPDWTLTYDIGGILEDIYRSNRARWTEAA
ncbi:MAG: NAD-dependent epimerase/dehydratase family protein [Pseudomonadota bacterium]